MIVVFFMGNDFLERGGELNQFTSTELVEQISIAVLPETIEIISFIGLCMFVCRVTPYTVCAGPTRVEFVAAHTQTIHDLGPLGPIACGQTFH